MSKIQALPYAAVPSAVVTEAVEAYQLRQEIIPASVAAHIASWWQSSGTVGSALASLASGAPVDRVAVIDDLQATIRSHELDRGVLKDSTFREELRALQALGMWVITAPAVPED